MYRTERYILSFLEKFKKIIIECKHVVLLEMFHESYVNG